MASKTTARRVDALALYRQVAADFDGLHDVEHVRARVEALTADGDVRDQLQRRARLAREWNDYNRILGLFLKAAGGDKPVNVGWSVNDLRIEPLTKRAANTADPVDAQAAARMLEQTFVSASFYMSRSLLTHHAPDRAPAVLQVANAIHADRPDVLLNMARAYAGMNDADNAFTILERAIDHGASVDVLRSDSTLLSLRDDPRYGALLARPRK